MTLRSKLLLAAAPLALAVVVLGAVAVSSLGTLGRSGQRILEANYRSVLAVQRMKEAVERLDGAALARVAGRPEEPALAGAHLVRFEAELAAQEGNLTERGEEEVTARLRAAWSVFRARLARLERLAGPAAAEAYFSELAPSLEAVRGAADAVLALNQDAMVSKSDRARREAEWVTRLVVLVALATLLAGAAASTAVTARLLRPVTALSVAARRLGEGHLEARAPVRGKDEIAGLAREFNTMADRLGAYRASSLGELLQAQQASQATLDSLPDPVLVLAAGGGALAVNRAAEEVLRIDPGAGDVTAALAPALREAVARVRDHVLGGNGPWIPRGFDEAVRVDEPGGTRWLLPRATPLYAESGSVAGATVLLQDVSRLMRFDELTRDVVATAAHELRTPLTSLHMAIHLCLEGAAGPVSEQQADLLHAAREDCERLQALVSDLLDVSRLHAGRVELRVRAVEAAELLGAAADAARAPAERAGLALRVSAPGGLQALADPERIAVVLDNLVSNAVRLTPGGGAVELRAAREGGSVRFEVEDTGPGIAPELQGRVFERFFQVPGMPHGGAGLGLHLAREIVLAHGGVIGLESAPGRGARFWFTLPAAGTEVAPDGG